MLGHRPRVTHHPWPHTDESVELPSFPFQTRALPLAECKQQMQACRVLLPPPQHLHTYHPHQHIVHASAQCPGEGCEAPGTVANLSLLHPLVGVSTTQIEHLPIGRLGQGAGTNQGKTGSLSSGSSQSGGEWPGLTSGH